MIDPAADEARPFADLLHDWRQADSVGTDDVLSAVLPLIEQVAGLHEDGRVAPLNGVDALRVSMGHLWFQNKMARSPETNASAVREIERHDVSRLQVTGRYRERSETGSVSVVDEAIADRSEEKPRRAYYPDYIAWEQQAGHHDQLIRRVCAWTYSWQPRRAIAPGRAGGTSYLRALTRRYDAG